VSETAQIILAAICLVGLFILTRIVITWKFRSVSTNIIRDLKAKGATGPQSAVGLPYEKPHPIRIGMRDYPSKALEYLVQEGVVKKTGAGKYYLSKEVQELMSQTDQYNT
jgi:hypothetical protein